MGAFRRFAKEVHVVARILRPSRLFFLSLELHYALLAVAAFVDGLVRGVHDRVARAVAAVVVDDAAGLEV